MQLHRAVTDITGETGQKILKAIISGERKPEALAQHHHYRCKKTETEIAAALCGDWRPEHLFTLRQSFQAWQYHQELIAECETELRKQSAELADQTKEPASPKARPDKRCDENMRQHLFGKFGVDLTAVDVVNTHTAYVFLSEVGSDLSKFASAEHFSSRMGLCPDNRRTGGQPIGVSTRAVANRLATALRMATQSLHRMDSPLGEWFRRMKAKLGPAGATTAAAHKLARVLYSMIKHRRPFDPARVANPKLRQARKEKALRRAAEELGYVLQPIQAVAVS